MSTVEGSEPGVQPEQKSSIAIKTTAKGEPVAEVKAYEGVTEDEMERLRKIAVAQYQALLEELRVGRAA